jgi:hypothetical protein
MGICGTNAGELIAEPTLAIEIDTVKLKAVSCLSM